MIDVPMLLPAILALHAVVAVLLPPLVRRLGPRAFLAAGVPPAVSAVWALSQAPAIVAGHPATAELAWAPALGIGLNFRVDALSLAMIVLVSGIGAVIFCYCAAYFHQGERGLGRLAAVLVLFSGAMLGVVTTDNLFALYVFWELTSVTSFLLVGHDDRKEHARRAATQALVTTAGTGLLMLIGFVMLGHAAGDYSVSGLVADPPDGGPWLTVALVLVLAGAFGKSAQVPLHYWLPGAMVAPTPVSAYLHAAAMVKGGVYLVARLAPGFADAELWRWLVLGFGLATMLVGGWRALRQDDLKLLLAYGTVSQLGFLVLLGGTGTQVAGVAMIAMLLAHGFFKSALFLTVGIIDHQTGTRSISRLTGLGRRMPVLAVAATLAAASMAGLPPLIGFAGKEAALEAFVPGAAPAPGPQGAAVMLTGLVLGSILTFAYSARFVWGAFADKTTVSERGFRPPSAAFAAAPVVLTAVSLGLGLAPALADPLAQAYAHDLPAGHHAYHLSLWHGITLPLLLTGLVIAAGALMFLRRRAVSRLQNRMPRWPDAEYGYHLFVHGVYTVALSVTRRTQSGSLPVYLGIILATMLVLPGARLAAGLITGEIAVPGVEGAFRLWDSPLELLVAAVVVVTAVATVREHRRFPALILLSVLGFGIAGMFVLHGAPDLALTLVLVETLTTIILVFVLRRLPTTFSVRPNGWAKRLTVLLCAAAGTFISLALWVMTAARTDAPISQGYTDRADEAGGDNLVNIILADFRALDTLGEIVVLATAAVAVASLVLLNRRSRVVDEPAAEVSVEAEEQAQLAAAEQEHADAAHAQAEPALGQGAEPARAAGAEARDAEMTTAPPETRDSGGERGPDRSGGARPADDDHEGSDDDRR
ncbi:hydrogen gas-evolving membrane-bound hydrogenase subunit E [Streptomonospora nanhaiensis]|uniref:Multicomponent Na+:H+ antiporter subunit A n=1 Tax=Streptomonospora nanhaiensis TaxID=1323731 RepID=A0A853BVZ5_9ACTN|nr:hydrogen gas-evolving membrane-bound hydrogenase subunit E [Streptomonospora nanhaiensis]NYI98657.1 multicomponent Na+:H+ antiporter subunit A [Streptomonospora nanhaiensis]